MSPHTLERCWYALHTRSNFERQVTTQLSARGIETYWPAVKETCAWADREKLVERPIFPGYVFARFRDDAPSRLAVHKANGVVRILGFSSHIEPVPDQEVASIRRLLASGHPCFSHPFIREGSRVRVTRGPLRGMEGTLVRFKNQTRLVLSVDLLSQSVATEVGLYDVEAIKTGAISVRA